MFILEEGAKGKKEFSVNEFKAIIPQLTVYYFTVKGINKEVEFLDNNHGRVWDVSVTPGNTLIINNDRISLKINLNAVKSISNFLANMLIVTKQGVKVYLMHEGNI